MGVWAGRVEICVPMDGTFTRSLIYGLRSEIWVWPLIPPSLPEYLCIHRLSSLFPPPPKPCSQPPCSPAWTFAWSPSWSLLPFLSTSDLLFTLQLAVSFRVQVSLCVSQHLIPAPPSPQLKSNKISLVSFIILRRNHPNILQEPCAPEAC